MIASSASPPLIDCLPDVSIGVATRLSAAETRTNRHARATDAAVRQAYRRLQFGEAREEDWARFLPATEIERRARLRRAHVVGARCDPARVVPFVPVQGSHAVELCAAQVRAALAAAGLGGLGADGEVECVARSPLPGGYDPLVNEIWMDETWYRALEEFAGAPVAHARKAVTFHLLVHEHVHVNSAINADLRDPGFLDPDQPLIEEACVDTLARRVTYRLLGRAVGSPVYASVVETMNWLETRTGRDVAFDTWTQPRLSTRVSSLNAAMREALGVAGSHRTSAARLSTLVRETGDLHLLLDAPGLLEDVARALSAARSCWRRRLLVRPGLHRLCGRFEMALGERRARRARGMRQSLGGAIRHRDAIRGSMACTEPRRPAFDPSEHHHEAVHGD